MKNYHQDSSSLAMLEESSEDSLVAYPKKIEQEMLSFAYSAIEKYLPKDKIFTCQDIN